MEDNTPARTRIAPSPTGEYHIGHIRTCLYDYALAKSTGGQFVVRIEDTDRERYKPETVDKILDVLTDYGLLWDEGPRVGGPYGPYIQSERFLGSDKYLDIAKGLIDQGNAYYCFCTKERLAEVREQQLKAGRPPMYDRHCRFLSEADIKSELESGKEYVVRLKIPEHETIEYTDIVVGKVSWKSDVINDEILIKSNKVPSYQMAVVIDDHEMHITHVMRGVEWISSTPKQVLLYKYLGWEMPKFAHLSVILDFEGKGKLSKRKSGEKAFARYYLDQGYLTEAMLNYLMLLGWSPKEQKDLLTLDEFVGEFSLDRLQPQNPRVSLEKIEWFGGMYMRKLSVDDMYDRFNQWIEKIENVEIKAKATFLQDYFQKDVEKAKAVLSLCQERTKKFVDLFDQTIFFYDRPEYTEETYKFTKHELEDCKNVMGLLKEKLESSANADNKWDQLEWEGAIRSLAETNNWKAGDLFMLLRLAIVGSPFSPPLINSMNILGKDECIARIEQFSIYLKSLNK